MFSKWSSSSISLATVTPSLVIVGAPHDFSITTLRPRGPSVTFTALASASSPAPMCARALLLNRMSFAVIGHPLPGRRGADGPSRLAALALDGERRCGVSEPAIELALRGITEVRPSVDDALLDDVGELGQPRLDLVACIDGVQVHARP